MKRLYLNGFRSALVLYTRISLCLFCVCTSGTFSQEVIGNQPGFSLELAISVQDFIVLKWSLANCSGYQFVSDLKSALFRTKSYIS